MARFVFDSQSGIFHLASFACSAPCSCVRMYLCRNYDVQMLKSSSSSVLFVVFIFRLVFIVANFVVWSRLTSNVYFFLLKTVFHFIRSIFVSMYFYLKCTNPSRLFCSSSKPFIYQLDAKIFIGFENAQ